MFVTALFTIVKRWKQPKDPLMNECRNKMWSIHTTEYYSALKRKEILTNATTYIWNLKKKKKMVMKNLGAGEE